MKIIYKVSEPVSDEDLNQLYFSAWPHHRDMNFENELNHCYYYICGYLGLQLVSFVKVIWDGNQHGFLLEPTVHSDFQRQGLGRELLLKAIEVGKTRGLTWMHVDFESHLTSFYRSAGFRHTEAGLINLRE